MAKRNFLNNNNEVITEVETAEGTIRTEETIQEALEELVAEVVAEPVAEVATDVEETISETVVETVVETENTLLAKRVCELESRVYNIELQLIETGDLVKVELQITPTIRNKDLVVANYIEQHFASKKRYKRFTVVSIK